MTNYNKNYKINVKGPATATLEDRMSHKRSKYVHIDWVKILLSALVVGGIVSIPLTQSLFIAVICSIFTILLMKITNP